MVEEAVIGEIRRMLRRPELAAGTARAVDPTRGAPLIASPASVTVVARTCAEADAWATALMAKGSLEGAILARKRNLSALFIDREGDHLHETRVGRLFETRPDPERVN